jgi:hypothetical protein
MSHYRIFTVLKRRARAASPDTAENMPSRPRTALPCLQIQTRNLYNKDLHGIGF